MNLVSANTPVLYLYAVRSSPTHDLSSHDSSTVSTFKRTLRESDMGTNQPATMTDARLSLEEISSLLSQHGGDFNARGVTGLSVILAAAHHHGTSPNFPVLHYLLEREDIPRIDKIDALEMAGAVILSNYGNHAMFPLAFQYWRRALALRMQDIDYCRPIYKTPTKSKSGQLSEWSTLDDLLRIEGDPAQRLIQSLLVRLRISSSICWAAVNECFFPSYNFFLMMQHFHEGWISQILDVSWSTFDTILRSERPHERQLLDSVLKIENVLICHFQILPKDSINSENLQKLVELLLMTDMSYLTHNPITNLEKPVVKFDHLFHLGRMIDILSTNPEMVTEEIRLSLLQFVRRDARDSSGCNLLHMTCLLPVEPSLSSIRFLVNQLGADPNARIINHGSGVLHILAFKPESETRVAAARLLLQLGAHLDMADELGRTAGDRWLQKNNQERHRLPDWLKEGVPKLKCLSSRVVRRFKVPHDETNTPALLIPFVALH